MAWTVCAHSRREIDDAGQAIISLPRNSPARNAALDIVNNWRSCHGFPLQSIRYTLAARATQKIGPHAVVVQRIKRLRSIQIELEQQTTMRLSQMQDLGGCRAIVNVVDEVDTLVAIYDKAAARNRRGSPKLLRKTDYIMNPKPDRYRGVHLIMGYQSAAKPEYNGQKIEIQIRSRLQHAWATAVETYEVFTVQALKTKIKSVSADVSRFFALVSNSFAITEKRNPVPDTPTDMTELRAQLIDIDNVHKLITKLRGFRTTMDKLKVMDPHAFLFLLELDASQLPAQFRISTFTKFEIAEAQDAYAKREKETEGSPQIQVVLVSAKSVEALKLAYPNYYVDTETFITHARMAMVK